MSRILPARREPFVPQADSQLLHLPAVLDGYPELDLLSRALSFTTASVRVSTRIEAYSCKTINREKRLFKTLEQDIKSDLDLSTSISPPDQQSANLQSAFGPLNQSASRKTMWLLIATLNLAFPDHDFSRVNPEEFVKEDGARNVLNSLTGVLSNLRASGQGGSAGQLAGADAAFRASLFASYPPSMPALPGYNPLEPTGRAGRRSKLAAASTEKYGSSAPASASTSSRRSRDSKHSGSSAGRSAFPKAKDNSSGTSTSRTARKGSSSAAYMNQLRTDLDKNAGADSVPTHPFLRQVLEPIIELGDCEVYSYTPDLESDPHAYNSEEEDLDLSADEDLESYDDMDSRVYDRQADDMDIGWEMDGVDSSYASTPIGSVPPTPSGRPRTRKRRFPSHLGALSGESGGGYSLPNLALYDDSGMRSPYFGSMDPEADNDNDEFYYSRGNDDDAGGLLWSSNYFMYNKKMRRILFISCWARKVGSSPVPMTMALPPVQHVHAPASAYKPPSSGSEAQAKSASREAVEQPDAEPVREASVPSILSSYQPSKATASIIFGGGRSSNTPPIVRESSPAVPRGTSVHANVSRGTPPPPARSTRKNLNNRTSPHSTSSSFERLAPISTASGRHSRSISSSGGPAAPGSRKRRSRTSEA